MTSYVIKILEDYFNLKKLEQKINYDRLSRSEKDNFRLGNDNDALYYHKELELERNEALKADTIVSFWTPYKTLLELEAGWTAYKTKNSLNNLLRQIRYTHTNDYTSKINSVNKKIEKFAKVCYTKGNYMLLPERSINPLRYDLFEDRIDLTLFNCFGNGSLSKYFKTEEELLEWIKKERLDIMFKDKKISREHIKWFVSEEEVPKKISKMTASEIYEYLNNAILLIESRNITEN